MGILLTEFEKGRKILWQAQEDYTSLLKSDPLRRLSEDELLDFSLSFANGIHIIRNTLDHAMWRLALEHPAFDEMDPRAARSISFPIVSEERIFNKWKRDVGRLYYSSEVISFVEFLQLYKNREPLMHREAVFKVSRWDNFAKHRATLKAVQIPVLAETYLGVVEDGYFVKKPFKQEKSLALRLQALIDREGIMVQHDIDYSFHNMEVFTPFKDIVSCLDKANFSLPSFIWTWDQQGWEERQG